MESYFLLRNLLLAESIEIWFFRLAISIVSVLSSLVIRDNKSSHPPAVAGAAAGMGTPCFGGCT